MGTGYRKTGFFVRGTGHFIIQTPEFPKFANFCEIFWCIAGSACFEWHGQKFQLNPGWVWYFPPCSTHRITPMHPYLNYRWLSIDGPKAGELFESLHIQGGLTQVGACPEELFTEVELNLTDGTLQSQMRALNAAFKILTGIVAPDEEARPLAERAKTVINENYRNSALNTSKVSELLYVHRTTLCRAFKTSYGISPGEYLTSVRLQAGMRLLSGNSLSIMEIAEQCGYSSAGYFCKVLHHQTGKKPSDFRAYEKKMLIGEKQR